MARNWGRVAARQHPGSRNPPRREHSVSCAPPAGRWRWPPPPLPAPPRPNRATPSPCMASRRCRPISPRCRRPTPTRPGGASCSANSGGFNSLNPFILKGRAPFGLSPLTVETLMGRSYDEPFTLYGLLAEIGRDGCRAQLCRVHAAARGALFGRRTGDRRGRHVVVRDPRHEGPPPLPRRLGQDRRHGADGPALGALHLQHRRPRTAADSRPSPDPAEGPVGRAGIRRIGPRGAGRLGALRRGKLRTRPLRRLPQGPRLVGGGAALQPRPAQLDEIRYDYFGDAGWCSRPSRRA